MTSREGEFSLRVVVPGSLLNSVDGTKPQCTWGATLDRVDYSKNNKDMKLEGEKEGVDVGKMRRKMKGS